MKPANVTLSINALGWTYQQAADRLEDDQWQAYQAIWRYSAPRFSIDCGLPSVRLVNAYLDCGLSAEDFDQYDLVPRYAPYEVTIGTRGDFQHVPVDQYVFHPAGTHKSPIRAEWPALELRTRMGSRWYGCLHAYINSQLHMVVIGFPRADEVRRTWSPVPLRHQ